MARKVWVAASIEVAEGPEDSALESLIADRLRTTNLILRVESVDVQREPEPPVMAVKTPVVHHGPQREE